MNKHLALAALVISSLAYGAAINTQATYRIVASDCNVPYYEQVSLDLHGNLKELAGWIIPHKVVRALGKSEIKKIEKAEQAIDLGIAAQFKAEFIEAANKHFKSTHPVSGHHVLAKLRSTLNSDRNKRRIISAAALVALFGAAGSKIKGLFVKEKKQQEKATVIKKTVTEVNEAGLVVYSSPNGRVLAPAVQHTVEETVVVEPRAKKPANIFAKLFAAAKTNTAKVAGVSSLVLGIEAKVDAELAGRLDAFAAALKTSPLTTIKTDPKLQAELDQVVQEYKDSMLVQEARSAASYTAAQAKRLLKPAGWKNMSKEVLAAIRSLANISLLD